MRPIGIFAAILLVAVTPLAGQLQRSGDTTIISSWGHESEPLGPARSNSAWKRLSTGDVLAQEVTDTNPLYPAGGRYYHTRLRNSGNKTLNAERRHLVPPENKKMGKLGNHWAEFESTFTAFWMRVDEADDVEGHYFQWHDNPGGDGRSPPLSLVGSNKGARLRLEKNADHGGHDYYSDFLVGPEWMGRSIAWVIQTRWDTRSHAQGSNGIVRVWADGELVFEWLNKANCHSGASTDGRRPYFKWGLYKTAYNWGDHTPGAIMDQSYDNLTVGGGSETPASMWSAIGFGVAAPISTNPEVTIPDPDPDPMPTPDPIP